MYIVDSGEGRDWPERMERGQPGHRKLQSIAIF